MEGGQRGERAKAKAQMTRLERTATASRSHFDAWLVDCERRPADDATWSAEANEQMAGRCGSYSMLDQRTTRHRTSVTTDAVASVVVLLSNLLQQMSRGASFLARCDTSVPVLCMTQAARA